MSTTVTGGGSVALLVDEAALSGGTSQGSGADVATRDARLHSRTDER